MSFVVDNAHKSRPDTRLPPMQHETDLGDIRLILLPPGPVNIRSIVEFTSFDVNLGGATHDYALNSDRLVSKFCPPETINLFSKGAEYRLRADNPLPGCILEVSDGCWHDWLEKGEVSKQKIHSFIGRPDSVGAELGRSAIRHLMKAARSDVPADRLTVEALALAIAARGMAQLTCPDGDIDGAIAGWTRRTRERDIDRVIDLIEARLSDADLSISDLAKAACLSSSHFASVFRSMVGETPYRFILRRRAEYARDLIIGTQEPLAQIAFDSGFSSQAHMTVVIRRSFGVTPAAMRS